MKWSPCSLYALRNSEKNLGLSTYGKFACAHYFIVNYGIATKFVGTLCFLKNLIIDRSLGTFLHLYRLLHSPNNNKNRYVNNTTNIVVLSSFKLLPRAHRVKLRLNFNFVKKGQRRMEIINSFLIDSIKTTLG